ncbi:unnamed protein product, partial [Arabidopsis halleri]
REAEIQILNSFTYLKMAWLSLGFVYRWLWSTIMHLKTFFEKKKLIH